MGRPSMFKVIIGPIIIYIILTYYSTNIFESAFIQGSWDNVWWLCNINFTIFSFGQKSTWGQVFTYMTEDHIWPFLTLWCIKYGNLCTIWITCKVKHVWHSDIPTYFGESLECIQNRSIASTSTQVAFYSTHHLITRWFRVISQQCVHWHYHTRGTESTLGTMTFGYSFLYGLIKKTWNHESFKARDTRYLLLTGWKAISC